MLQDFQLGLKNGKVVHAEAVPSGIKCNCYCPSCGGRFVAYKGQVLRPHFKHLKEANCSYSFESSLHFLAKEIIQQKKFLDLPFLHWEIPFTPSSWFPKSNDQFSKLPPFQHINFQRVYFDKVEVEQWEGNFKPDLKCYVGQKQLLVEIKVSHGIDENKLNKIKLKDIPLLEIDLSHLKNEVNKKTLTRELYPRKHSLHLKTESFRWIHNPKYDKLKLAEQEKSQRIFNFLNHNRRNIKLYGRNKEIYNCPLMQKAEGPYKFVETCEFCNYNLGKTEHHHTTDETVSKSTDWAVVCIGHKKYELEMLFNECGAKPTANSEAMQPANCQ
jgi:hypothetical protein